MNNEEQPLTLAQLGDDKLDGPWKDPHECTPIPRRAMYALAVANVKLAQAIAQRSDCPADTVREVSNALAWLDDFTTSLRRDWKPAAPKPQPETAER